MIKNFIFTFFFWAPLRWTRWTGALSGSPPAPKDPNGVLVHLRIPNEEQESGTTGDRYVNRHLLLVIPPLVCNPLPKIGNTPLLAVIRNRGDKKSSTQKPWENCKR